MRPLETIIKRGEGEKRMMEGVNLRCIVSTFVNITTYPQYNNNMLIKI
jgi:hypothetical protein